MSATAAAGMRSSFSASFKPGAEGGASAVSGQGSPSHPTAQKSPETTTSPTHKHTRGIDTSRAIFLLTLVGVATLLGIAAHRLISNSEYNVAAERFDSISESALNMARTNAQRQRLGIVTLASIVEQSLPDAEPWPLVHVNGFRTMAQNVIETASAMHMGFMPLVKAEERADFEDYAVDTVMNGNAATDRMWGMDENRQKYNETDGSTYWGSPHRIFTPFYQHSHEDALFLMNWHSIEARGRLVDQMIDCSEARALEMMENAENPDFQPRDCSVYTDIIDLEFKPVVEIPGAVVAHPVYPANDPTVMTGLITSAMDWHRTFEDVFSNDVSGVDLVLSTETQAFTYQVVDGRAILKGSGDMHDRSFDQYAQSVVLGASGERSGSFPRYTLSAYPNGDLFAIYESNNPAIAAIGAVCIIVFTSILFFLYDFFVRTEFNHRETVSRARSQFVRFISHEVRTPLNTVCMGLQLLQGQVRNPVDASSDQDRNHERIFQQIGELGQDMLTNVRSAVEVLNDLLNYDKVESGTLHLELAVLSIFDLVERTVAEFRQPAKLKNIDLSLDYGALRSPELESAADTVASAVELPSGIQNLKVIGDGVRITQVLRNLCSNALKFTHEGGKISILLSLMERDKPHPKMAPPSIELYSGETVKQPHSSVLRIEVTDTGAGMAPHQIKNLFKEGVQFDVNELQSGQGSGLGMYITKGIIQQHGGTLAASSEGKGHGTTFVVTLPLYDIPDTPEPEQASPPKRTLHWNKLEPLRILVVDDAGVNRKLVVRLLQRQRHICEEAENGLVAVEHVRALEGERYHCILMDYEMPEMNGHEATRALRKSGCDSFIVGVTGTLFSDDVKRFMQCGADAVLPKPLEMRDLMDILLEHSVADTPGGLATTATYCIDE